MSEMLILQSEIASAAPSPTTIGKAPQTAADGLAPWDGELYATNTGHHRARDANFLTTLALRRTDRVLDLGCGAGDLTATVAARVPDGAVVGLEPQVSLLQVARRRAGPNQTFVEASVQQLASVLPEDAAFGIVMSQSVLHWVPERDHPALLADVRRLLRPGGWFRAEFGGIGNVPAVLALLDDVSAKLGGPVCPWWFADAGTYLELVERAGLDAAQGFVRTTAQRRSFTRDGLLGWFRSQCTQAYEVGLSDEARPVFHAEVESRFDELARWDASFDQTFVRMEVLARRAG